MCEKRERVRYKLFGNNGYGPHVFDDDEVDEVERQLTALEISIVRGMALADAELITALSRHAEAGAFARAGELGGQSWHIISALADRFRSLEWAARSRLARSAQLMNAAADPMGQPGSTWQEWPMIHVTNIPDYLATERLAERKTDSRIHDLMAEFFSEIDISERRFQEAVSALVGEQGRKLNPVPEPLRRLRWLRFLYRVLVRGSRRLLSLAFGNRQRSLETWSGPAPGIEPRVNDAKTCVILDPLGDSRACLVPSAVESSSDVYQQYIKERYA